MADREDRLSQNKPVERLKWISLRWMDEIWTKRHIHAVDELHGDHFRDHSPAGRDTDNRGYKKGLIHFFTAFPDFRAETEGLVIDSTTGEVAIRWSARGTHLGEFLGLQPTGKQVRFRGIEILKIEHDKIVERWGEWDGLGLVEQLSSKHRDG